ncbi:endonuclease/exonuclease/phosphatase family protein, partial [Ostertagia ostertagi]
MTALERKQYYDLRQECKKRNEQAKNRTWVVFRGELRQVNDLPRAQQAAGNGLNCLLFNSRSLSNKLHHLHLLLSTCGPDILFITETWLSPKISDSEIIIDLPYKLFRYDRTHRKGGGVCCLVKNGLKISPNLSIPESKSDILCLDVFDSLLPENVRIVLIYRPPDSSVRDDEQLVDILLDLSLSFRYLILLGDFNLDVDWNTFTPKNACSSRFLDFFKCCGLTQYVLEPTRGDSILDLVLSSVPLLRNVSIQPPFVSSDHNCVAFQIELTKPEVSKLPLPDFNKTDFRRLSLYLDSVDWWDALCYYASVDDLYRKFCRVIYMGLAMCVPFHSTEPHRVRYPKHVVNLMAHKLRLFNSLSNPLVNPSYIRICSELDRHLRKFLINSEKHANNSVNSKAIFSLINKKMKARVTLPVLRDDAGNRYLDDESKAEALAKYFSSVFLATTDSHVVTDDTHTSSISPEVMASVCIHPTEVLHVLKTLKCSTSATFDGIPQIIYKKCAISLYKPLAMIFNASLLFNEVPSLWKESIVTAIPKSSDSVLLSSYRPISITPPPIKILEKIVRDKILAWLNKNNSIPLEQHGFVARAS